MTQPCVQGWVVYAEPQQQWLWSVSVPPGATLNDAIAQAREQAGELPIAWDQLKIGVFGIVQPRTALFKAGDRVELYRPLAADPRERRRQQVQAARRR
jgi:uncharacterized protein